MYKCYILTNEIKDGNIDRLLFGKGDKLDETQ